MQSPTIQACSIGQPPLLNNPYIPHLIVFSAVFAVLFFVFIKRWTHKKADLLVLLVRHCQSTANVDASVYESMPDHAIPLSDLGIKTTLELGTKLSEYLEQRFNKRKKVKCKLLVSPFRRTRETASLLLKTELQSWVTEVEESCFLCEQDWGLFEGTGLVKGRLLYPREYEHLQTQKRWRGKFWARMPMGESAFDVCQRVCQLFHGILNSREKAAEEGHSAQVVIVVSHGVTSRAFIMMWSHFSPEWFDSSYNFLNGACHGLDSTVPGWYVGSVFGGFDENGDEQPAVQAIVKDPVHTHCNHLYYKFVTEKRWGPVHAIANSMHTSYKRSSMMMEQTLSSSLLKMDAIDDESTDNNHDEKEKTLLPFSNMHAPSL